MTRIWRFTIPTIAVIAGLALGLGTTPLHAQQKNVLTAKKAASAPATDGTVDAAGQGAPALTVSSTT
jgi:hypothetical protein